MDSLPQQGTQESNEATPETSRSGLVVLGVSFLVFLVAGIIVWASFSQDPESPSQKEAGATGILPEGSTQKDVEEVIADPLSAPTEEIKEADTAAENNEDERNSSSETSDEGIGGIEG